MKPNRHSESAHSSSKQYVQSCESERTIDPLSGIHGEGPRHTEIYLHVYVTSPGRVLFLCAASMDEESISGSSTQMKTGCAKLLLQQSSQFQRR